MTQEQQCQEGNSHWLLYMPVESLFCLCFSKALAFSSNQSIVLGTVPYYLETIKTLLVLKHQQSDIS